MEVISQSIISMLWVVRNLECIPPILSCILVNNVFKHCVEKLKPHLHKCEDIGDRNMSDALNEEDKYMIAGSLQSHEYLLNPANARTSGEHQGLFDNPNAKEGAYMEISKSTLINQLHGETKNMNDTFHGQGLKLAEYGVFPF